MQRFGRLDTLVVNHARSSVGDLSAVTAEELDRTWVINVRATLLLVQVFAEQCPRTGWATDEVTADVRRALPRGRWNTPDEAAGVVALLLTTDAATITGRVIDAEAGFRRWKM